MRKNTERTIVMKMQKRLLALCLCAALTTGLLAGCNNKNDSKKDNSSPAATNTSLKVKPGEDNGYGWIVPEEPLHISVFGTTVQDQDKTDKDEKVMREFYEQYFNVFIDVRTFSMDNTEKLNLMLANNDYPDVLAGISDMMAEKFIAQKRAVELTDLMAENGTNFDRRLGKYMNLLKNEEGKLYKLPIFWGETPNVAGYNFAVRYDYWKETGLPMYETLDDYYNVLKKIVEMHPTNANGDKVYALSNNSKNDAPPNDNILNTMLAAYGFKSGYKVDPNTNEFTHWVNTPEGLEIARYVNRFYREGLIDPDFLNNDYETMLTKTFNETIVGNIGVWWHSWTAGQEKWAQEMGDDYNIEKRFINVTIDVPGVEEPTYLNSSFLGSYRTIITNKVETKEKAAEILRFMNWENSELGNFIVGYGPPSDDNVWNIKDDKWIFKDNTFDNATKNENVHNVKEANGAGTIWLSASGGLLEDERIDPRVTRVSAYDFWPVNEKGEFLDEGVNLSWQHATAKPWDSTLFAITYDAKNPISQVYQTVSENIITEWAKLITSESEEALENQFKETQAKLNQLGLEELTKFNQESYLKNLEKLNG